MNLRISRGNLLAMVNTRSDFLHCTNLRSWQLSLYQPSVVVFRSFPYMVVFVFRFLSRPIKTYLSLNVTTLSYGRELNSVSLRLATRENIEVDRKCSWTKFVRLLTIFLLYRTPQRVLYSWSPLKSWATLQRRKATQKMVQ